MDKRTVTLRGGPRDGDAVQIPANATILVFPVFVPGAKANDLCKTADYRPLWPGSDVFVFVETSSCEQ